MFEHTRRRLIIPAAGNGRRFAEKGYKNPKPFIDVKGVPMIELVIRNMRDCLGHMPTVVILREEDRVHANKLMLKDVEFVFEVDHRGAAATLLSVLTKHVDMDEEIIIANSDQMVQFDGATFWKNADGSVGTILTFECPMLETKWSYAEIDENGALVRVAEKVPISTHATVGVYRFASCAALIEAIKKMMMANDRTNGEYYLCPTYNYLETQMFKPVRIVNVRKMYALGTPEDLELTITDEEFLSYARGLLLDH